MAVAKPKSLVRPSSSFRLKSPSLNCLRLRRIFDMFDQNGDDIISIDELSQALDLLGLEADISEIESMVQSYIKPGNTGLTFDDFESLHQSLNDTFFGNSNSNDDDCHDNHHDCRRGGEEDGEAAAAESSSQEDADLTEAFKVFDENGDGFISAQELQVVLRKLGMPEARDIGRVERMIFSVDRNQDGHVDFHEFKDMMHSIMVRSS
ncbi:calcium-binding protein CML42-like [Telopea speciosissima]|uniref:calcium-binding protein CML42-like n=1 Tax=Telopea speciosissima TaxID=54955 RepID=UPI001CC40E22|nr:calcium-binding protein CML42-like [Telopea speciosissima]